MKYDETTCTLELTEEEVQTLLIFHNTYYGCGINKLVYPPQRVAETAVEDYLHGVNESNLLGKLNIKIRRFEEN